MFRCLLCQETSQKRQLFSDIFLLKKKVPSLCQSCEAQYEPITGSVCQFCCKKSHVSPCSDCCYWQEQGKDVEHQALYHYNDKMKEYFSLYKFHGDYCLRKVFAKEVKLALSEYLDYTIVPIPISHERYEERGFNQVIGFLDAADISYHSILKKYHSQKQSEKTKNERLKTLQSFYLEQHISIPEKIILVDDIYTTGATIQLAKAVLMKKGAKTIKSFSISR